MTERGKKRGAYRREDCTFIGVWVPRELLRLVDSFVVANDLDRSKFLRRAVEMKLSRSGRGNLVGEGE